MPLFKKPDVKMSKHDDPNSELVFRNWKKEAEDLIASLPRGVECVAFDCKNLPTNRNAYLCRDCGIRYYDAFKNIASTSERWRAIYNWHRVNVLAKDPE